eukprot:6177898-Pleurochrysis_carterae.AAC.2
MPAENLYLLEVHCARFCWRSVGAFLKTRKAWLRDVPGVPKGPLKLVDTRTVVLYSAQLARWLAAHAEASPARRAGNRRDLFAGAMAAAAVFLSSHRR